MNATDAQAAVERLQEQLGFAEMWPGRNVHIDPDSARAILAHIDSLTAELAAAKAERDEADRRAGAAERQLEHANDNIRARTRWLDQAKDDAGFHRNVSFDKVWAAALAAYKVAIASGAHRQEGE